MCSIAVGMDVGWVMIEAEAAFERVVLEFLLR
ncbi:hypothetical protein NONO_c64910 [Nocardia nova SH22a]|uniref:Uncharacterized protein n=1 Tax=Nocardia nova SH22a TaxID=1415166 RepID=W5TVP9_9NOCA|nr:hypothetical protein NONO_c64910 [Nocardia nova SH22a]